MSAALKRVLNAGVAIDELHDQYTNLTVNYAGSSADRHPTQVTARKAVYDAAAECKRLASELATANHELAGRIRERRDA